MRSLTYAGPKGAGEMDLGIRLTGVKRSMRGTFLAGTHCLAISGEITLIDRHLSDQYPGGRSCR